METREIEEIPCADYDSIPVNTMDFGLCHTICFEMQEMCFKFSFVLVPREERGSARLRNWDLWGPFLMCLFFGFFIKSTSLSTQTPTSLCCCSVQSSGVR